MDWDWMLAVSGFALVMAGTPGPNNTLVTASGATHGFRRSLPLMTGIALGVAAIMWAVSAVGTTLIADPRVAVVLKWVGITYLLWLAWCIVQATPKIEATGQPRTRPLSLVQGALVQLFNPKLWAMVAGAVATYGRTNDATTSLEIASIFALIFGIATLASTAAWTLVGVGVGRIIKSQPALRVFNWTMAAFLVASLLPIIMS